MEVATAAAERSLVVEKVAAEKAAAEKAAAEMALTEKAVLAEEAAAEKTIVVRNSITEFNPGLALKPAQVSLAHRLVHPTVPARRVINELSP